MRSRPSRSSNHPSSGFRHLTQTRANGFTLVEMLMVMGIIAVLTGLLALGIRGLNGGINRRSAIGTLMGVFDQARTVAISDGRATYIVFVSAAHGQSKNTSPAAADMWGRAYAVFEDPILQDNLVALQPQQRSAWLYLPTGLAFKCDSSSDTSLKSLTTVPRETTQDTTQFTVATVGTAPLMLPYLKFDPAGQIIDSSGNVLPPGSPLLRVLLFEGMASNSGVETTTRQGAGTTGSNIKYAVDEITLKSTTGRARYTLDPSNNLAVSN